MKKSEKVRNYSALEVANLCGVVNQTAINWIKKKYLRAFMTPGGQYRVYGEDLAAFMQARGMKIPDELRGFVRSTGPTILFIDDDEYFSRQFLEDLEAEYPHCMIECARDGFEAGIKLASADRDLIFLNADMAGMSVPMVCQTIRGKPGGNGKSIIVFTERVDSLHKETVLKAGADVYIGKPFDVGQISIYLEA